MTQVAATHVYLIRHAHCVWRPGEERPLSDRGARSGIAVADLLAPRPIVAVYTSPARRAVQTIEVLADRRAIAPMLVPDLRERELAAVPDGEFEAAALATWQSPERALPGSESNLAAQARGVRVVRDVLEEHSGQHVVISTHGTLLALILGSFDARYGYEHWKRMTFPDVYALRFEGEALGESLRIWSDDGDP